MALKNKFGFSDVVDAQLIKQATVSATYGYYSLWEWEHWRQRKSGIYSQVDDWCDGNLCTDQGLTNDLGVGFSGDTQITAWYLLTFENDHTPAASDTYAVPGFTECTAIDEATRPAWSESGAAAKAISNSASKASFTYNATKTIYGGALVGGGTDANTKGDTAGGGILFNESQFSSGSKSVVNTDILKVSVSLSITNV